MSMTEIDHDDDFEEDLDEDLALLDDLPKGYAFKVENAHFTGVAVGKLTKDESEVKTYHFWDLEDVYADAWDHQERQPELHRIQEEDRLQAELDRERERSAEAWGREMAAKLNADVGMSDDHVPHI